MSIQEMSMQGTAVQPMSSASTQYDQDFQDFDGDQNSLQNPLAGVDPQQLAVGLGWFSIALGIAQVAAPQMMTQLIGLVESRNSQTVMSALGLREIVNGVAILAQPDNPLWVQTRVAGDMMDLAMLATAMASSKNDSAKVGAALAAIVGVTALDVLASFQLSGSGK